MKKVIFVLLVSLFVCASATAQNAPIQPAATQTATDAKPARKVFRATKDQVAEARKVLKAKGLYSGDAAGKLDDETRNAIKAFQGDSGLAKTGTLNRATLEKLGIELTENQKLIPVSENSFAKSAAESEAKPKRVIFRATKDQIAEAQKLLKSRSLYTGDESGKLDDATREALKKFQETNDIKATGTLNRVTLEKLGIELTDRQKEAAEAGKK